MVCTGTCAFGNYLLFYTAILQKNFKVTMSEHRLKKSEVNFFCLYFSILVL